MALRKMRGRDLGFAANGYEDDRSPGGYTMVAALVTEVVVTFMFLIVVLGTTHERAPVGFAGCSGSRCWAQAPPASRTQAVLEGPDATQ